MKMSTSYPTGLWSQVIEPWLHTICPATLNSPVVVSEPTKPLCPYQCYQTNTGCLTPWRNKAYQHGKDVFITHYVQTLKQLGPLWPTEGPLYERLTQVLLHYIHNTTVDFYGVVPEERARSVCEQCFRVCQQTTDCPFCQHPKAFRLPPCYPVELYPIAQCWFDTWQRLLQFLDYSNIQKLVSFFDKHPIIERDMRKIYMIPPTVNSESFNFYAYSTERLAKTQYTHKLCALWNIQAHTSLRQLAECCYRAWERPSYACLPTGQYYVAYKEALHRRDPRIPVELLLYTWTFVFGDVVQQTQALLQNTRHLWRNKSSDQTDMRQDLQRLVDCFGVLAEPQAYLRLCVFSTSTLQPVYWALDEKIHKLHVTTIKACKSRKTTLFSILLETRQSLLCCFPIVYVLRQGYFAQHSNVFYTTLLDLLLHMNHEHWSYIQPFTSKRSIQTDTTFTDAYRFYPTQLLQKVCTILPV